MEQVCPLCNGLRGVRAKCPGCGTVMEDGGMVTDYVGPYAPYELSAHERQQNDGICTHVLFCPQCEQQSYAVVQSELI